jgi:GAF domain-containing protein
MVLSNATNDVTASQRTIHLEALNLLDTRAEASFDALTRLASHLFGVPTALVSIIDEANDRQVFKSQLGLGAPWREQGETPLSHSFCKTVCARDDVVCVEDARWAPEFSANPAVVDLGVIAYLGAPVRDPWGATLGAICVIDRKPRQLREEDVAALRQLAHCVSEEIAARALCNQLAAWNAGLSERLNRTKHYSAFREAISLAFIASNAGASDRIEGMLEAARTVFAADLARITEVTGHVALTRFQSGMTSDGFAGPQPVPGSYTGQLVFDRRVLSLAPCDMPVFRDLQALPVSRFLGAPLMRGDEVIGTVEFIDHHQDGVPYSSEDCDAICLMALFLGSLLDRSPAVRTPVAVS